jgi:hypothetical protein
MGAERPDKPDFQLGDGCLVDQLVGQYLAEVAELGPLVDPAHIQKTLASIYRYNYKRRLYDHESVQRTFALNDEAALVICDYGSGKRPEVPFPYFAEVMTGFEYQAAAHMLYAGMVSEGVECIENIRRRYDGERRNPWDEAECGHHYARAMASWTGVLALSGFRYHGPEKKVTLTPRINAAKFRCFWSAAAGWGTFTHSTDGDTCHATLSVDEGSLPVRSVNLTRRATATSSAMLGGRALAHKVTHTGSTTSLLFAEEVSLRPGEILTVRA